MITLLAMAPSGEVFFTRDNDGVVHQHRRLGHHDPVEVGESTIDWVVDRYGYDRVNLELDNWGALTQYVERAIPTTELISDDLPVSATIARSALRVLERWLSTPADVPRIAPTVNRLLLSDAVLADGELARALVHLSSRALAELPPAPKLSLLAPTAEDPNDTPAPSTPATTRFDVSRAYFDGTYFDVTQVA